MSTSSSRRPQPRKPKLRGPLKPTTDLEVVAGEPPVTLAIPRPPRWLLPVLLAILTAATLAFPVRHAIAENGFRELEKTWAAASALRDARRDRIQQVAVTGEARDGAVADLLERDALVVDRLRGRHAWQARLDPDLARAEVSIDRALEYEAERLRSAAASYREHWSAGVNPCCGRTENAARRAEALLDRLKARFG